MKEFRVKFFKVYIFNNERSFIWNLRYLAPLAKIRPEMARKTAIYFIYFEPFLDILLSNKKQYCLHSSTSVSVPLNQKSQSQKYFVLTYEVWLNIIIFVSCSLCKLYQKIWNIQ